MIICGNCKKPSKSGEQTYEIIVKKRNRVYRNVILQGKLPFSNRQIKVRFNNEDIIKKYIQWGFKILKEFETQGSEIEKTIRICKQCYLKKGSVNNK